MTEDRELIWVTKEFAEEYKQLGSVEEQERAVKKLINNKRLDLEEEQELLSESLLQFKSVCLAHRKELEKVYKEQADTLYTLWEDMGDVGTMIAQHARKMASEIKPIRKEVDELNLGIKALKEKINKTNFYFSDQFVNIAATVGSMNEETKGLLRALLNMKEEGAHD